MHRERVSTIVSKLGLYDRRQLQYGQDRLEIAQEYAQKHPQIKVHANKQFVGLVENHNIAFRSISSDAKYCKLLSADDWMYPECISKLVDLAERNPSVGIVGSYAINSHGIRWGNLPLGEEVLDGRQASRLFLLGSIGWFLTPSTVLYRASLIRSERAFFPGSAPSADLEACLNCLKRSDLGFVHQILSFERIHDEAMTAKVGEMNSQLLDRIRILIEFGPTFLSQAECESRMEAQLSITTVCSRWLALTSGRASFGDCIRKGSVNSDTPSIAQDLQEPSSQNFLI